MAPPRHVFHAGPVSERAGDGAGLLRDHAAGAFHLCGVVAVDLDAVGHPKPGQVPAVAGCPFGRDLDLDRRERTPLLLHELDEVHPGTAAERGDEHFHGREAIGAAGPNDQAGAVLVLRGDGAVLVRDETDPIGPGHAFLPWIGTRTLSGRSLPPGRSVGVSMLGATTE